MTKKRFQKHPIFSENPKKPLKKSVRKSYENPKKRLDNLLLSGNRNVAAVYAKMKKSKALQLGFGAMT